MSALQKFVATCALLLLACISTSAFAFNETLTFRLNAQGQVEAVITGLTRGGGCDGLGQNHPFDPASSITIVVNNILIASPVVGVTCSIPFNPLQYQQVANLGQLTGATYQVTWNEGTPPIHSLSATLNMSDLYPGATPALSWWMTILLMLSLFGISIATLRRRAAHSRVKN
jgi:hypothetical protein